ncbi:hypothetical protein GLOIN_2v1776239 [Rhizophagus irregularis DAOM 181602=DAOM 197198]|uniref:Replication origin-binding protein domain-containing protein n=2 Tax=Rhizophagus irregularis TaxID=588596 RepID=A0A2P4PXQ4_RHIID|nr:hypothetical protein GLOIN_2v1776239 [Rhizophagus irregularis DAOM 181602=DAOM 197198]POG70163.1 hypothetical protein GLOIN_2v1776239 [Rhizophagus irregularis DAOM 181602=DAOM 197198]|eukprot:XP_025177029.1 hypothetical protein GLOIN_2v1776239 [Rhizophagus irregularis DAOM 181602=DAOM 197198]
MHTPTIFDQTDRTGPQAHYDGADPNKYLSDSDSYNDESDCGSDDYNNHESNCESDSEEVPCASTSTTVAPSFPLPRQEKFNNDFTPKDLLNSIREILSSLPRDMSNDKGSLDCLPIYSFLFSNEKGSSLYNAYDRDEVENKLVIKIDQDADRAPKFSVADDISEVYGLPGIHECINGQKPLRPVIDIDATQGDMESNGVKSGSVFIRICCSFIRVLYRILDCNWKDILKGLIITTSSDPSKCSYHILYAPALLIDHQELKAFTELVYTLTGEKFSKYIDRGLPGQNFNLRLIGLAKKGRVKQLKVRPRMLSIEKNNNLLRISVGRDILQKCANLVLQKHSNYLRDWNIEENDSQNFVYFNRKASLECPLCKRIHDKDQRWFGRVYASSGTFIVKCFRQCSDEPGEVFECDPSIAEKIQQENKNPKQSSKKVKAQDFPKALVKIPSWVKYSETLTATETYNERYVRPLPNEDDIYVGSPWETGKTYILKNLAIPNDVNLLVLSTRHSYSNAVTTRLNLKSYCDIDGNINLPDHKRVVCQIESLHRITNNCKCNKKCKCLPIHYDLWLDEIVSIIAQAQSRLAGQSIEKLYKLIQDARRIIVMDNDLTDLNIEWIKALRKDRVFSIIHNTYQPQEELQIKEYHGKSDPVEKAHDFSNVEEAWKAVDLVAYTSTLKIGNKKVPTIRLWVAYMLEKFRSHRLFGWRMVDFLRNAGMVISFIKLIPKPKDNTISLFQTVKVSSSIIKAEEISDISNARILDYEIAEVLENKPKKTLEEMRSLNRHHIVECYEIPLESLTEEFISKYRNYNHMKWFRAYRQLRDAGINNETAVEAIIRKDYREDKLIIATRAERHRICLELLRICTPAKDIDDRTRYKSDDVKKCLNTPESTSYLQGLVPKMARVFDNTNALRSAKKSGLKTIRAKISLLNASLYATYGLKFKAVDKSQRYYHLVGSFDSKDAPKFPSYQTGEEVYWENGKDTRYGYSKIPPDELLLGNLSSSSKVDNTQISEDIQNLIDIC